MSHFNQNPTPPLSFPCSSNTLGTYTALITSLINQERDKVAVYYQTKLAQLEVQQKLQQPELDTAKEEDLEVNVKAQSTEQDVQAELNSLRAQFQVLEQDRLQARRAEEAAKRQAESLRGEAEKSRSKMESLELFVSEMKREKSRLETELANLKESSNAEKERLLDEMERNRVEFSSRLEKVAREGANHEAKAIERLRRESNSLITSIRTKHAQSSRDADTALAESTKQVERYAQDLSKVKDERWIVETERDTAARALEDEKQLVRQARKRLASVHSRAKAAADKYHLSSQALAISIDHMRGNLNDAQTTAAHQMDDLRCQLFAAQEEGAREKEVKEKLGNRISSLDAIIRETEAARSAAAQKVTDLNGQLSAVQQEGCRAKESHAEEVSLLNGIIHNLESERTATRQQTEDLLCELSANRQEAKRMEENFAKRIFSLDAILRHHEIAFIEHDSYELRPCPKLVSLLEYLHKLAVKRPTSESSPPTPPIVPDSFTVQTDAVIPIISARVDHLVRFKTWSQQLKQTLKKRDQMIASLKASTTVASSQAAAENTTNSKLPQVLPMVSTSSTDRGHAPILAPKAVKGAPSSSLSSKKNKSAEGTFITPTASSPSNSNPSSINANANATRSVFAAFSTDPVSSPSGTKPSDPLTGSRSSGSKVSPGSGTQSKSSSTDELILLPSLKRLPTPHENERKSKRTRPSQTEAPARKSSDSSSTSPGNSNVPTKRPGDEHHQVQQSVVQRASKRPRTSDTAVPKPACSTSTSTRTSNPRLSAPPSTPSSQEKANSWDGTNLSKTVEAPPKYGNAPYAQENSISSRTADPRLSIRNSRLLSSPPQPLPPSSPATSNQILSSSPTNTPPPTPRFLSIPLPSSLANTPSLASPAQYSRAATQYAFSTKLNPRPVPASVNSSSNRTADPRLSRPACSPHPITSTRAASSPIVAKPPTTQLSSPANGTSIAHVISTTPTTEVNTHPQCAPISNTSPASGAGAGRGPPSQATTSVLDDIPLIIRQPIPWTALPAFASGVRGPVAVAPFTKTNLPVQSLQSTSSPTIPIVKQSPTISSSDRGETTIPGGRKPSTQATTSSASFVPDEIPTTAASRRLTSLPSKPPPSTWTGAPFVGAPKADPPVQSLQSASTPIVDQSPVSGPSQPTSFRLDGTTAMSGSTPSCIRDPLSFNSSLPSKSSPAHGSTMALGPSVTGATANPPIQNLQVASTPMRNEIQATSFSRPGRSSTAASSIQGPLDLTATLSPANGQNSQSLDSDTPTPSQATIAAWWSRVKLDRLPASEMETGTSSSITGPTRQPGHGGSREIEEQTLFSGTPTGPGNRGRDTSIHRQPGRREGSPSIRRSPSWADSPPSFRRSPSPAYLHTHYPAFRRSPSPEYAPMNYNQTRRGGKHYRGRGRGGRYYNHAS